MEGLPTELLMIVFLVTLSLLEQKQQYRAALTELERVYKIIDAIRKATYAAATSFALDT